MSRDFEKFPVPSLDAIAAQAGDDPTSVLYMSDRDGKLIVCSVGSVERGFHVEQEPHAILSYDCPMETLGQAIWESLLQFKRTPGLNLRSRKKTEWPAYRASGARSVRAFEDDYIRISVVGLRVVLRVQADVPAQAAHGLFVGRFISNACQFEALGELIHTVSRCGLLLAEQEFGRSPR